MQAANHKRPGMAAPAMHPAWSASPFAPLLSDSKELGYCLELLAVAAQGMDAQQHLTELLKIIDNIWQDPPAGESVHRFIQSEAAATRAYVRRKVYGLLLQKEAIAYSADPLTGWSVPCYAEAEAALGLEQKELKPVTGKDIVALLQRLIAFPEGREKDDLFSALGDYASMLWRAYLNTTDYRAPETMAWPLLRAAYEAEVAERNTSVYAISTDDPLFSFG